MAAVRLDDVDNVYRRMLDALVDAAVIMIDPAGTIQTWNEGATHVLGYTASDAIGRHVSMFRTKADIDAGLIAQELAHAATGRFQGRAWRIRKGGETFLATVVTHPIYDDDGGVEGFVKIIWDSTEQAAREDLLRRQREEILELSTPVIDIWDRVVLVPIVGTLDAGRADQLMHRLLTRIDQQNAGVVIVDLTAVTAIDTAVAQHLVHAIRGAQVMGAETVICGLRPETAQTMIHLGVDVGTRHYQSTLHDALRCAFTLLDTLASPSRPA